MIGAAVAGWICILIGLAISDPGPIILGCVLLVLVTVLCAAGYRD